MARAMIEGKEVKEGQRTMVGKGSDSGGSGVVVLVEVEVVGKRFVDIWGQ